MRLEDTKRETIAWALARGKTSAQAARDAGVDRATVTRWLRDDPSIRRRVSEVQLEIESTMSSAIGGVGESEGDAAAEARRGLARLIPIAEEVVEAALKGEDYNGKPVTAQQHQNALRTIDLAHKLQPRETTGSASAPALGELIREADARRARTN